MKTKYWIFFSLFGIWLLYHAFRLSKVFFAVSIASASNEPTLSQYSIHFCSKHAKPSLFKFLSFKNRHERNQPFWIYRVCGMPGDKVEIKNGFLFINDSMVDSRLTLCHSYVMRVMDTLGMNISDYATRPLNNSYDSLIISLADDYVKENNIPARQYIQSSEIQDSLISKKYGKPWNQDNFGPIQVPDNSYFLLGDNRSDAIDSRYIGCIKTEDVIGCMIF